MTTTALNDYDNDNIDCHGDNDNIDCDDDGDPSSSTSSFWGQHTPYLVLHVHLVSAHTDGPDRFRINNEYNDDHDGDDEAIISTLTC